MTNPKQKVLIVGAGLAGMAIYHKLDKNKFEIDIVEKRDKLQNLGYAIIMNPVGIRALKMLGYSNESVSKIGKSIDGAVVWNKNGEVLQVTDFKGFKNRFDDYQVVSRKHLYELLESNFSPDSLKMNLYPTSFKEVESKVLVQFSDSTEKEYDLVIGADGVYSQVREHIFPNTEIEDAGLMFMWAWFPRGKVTMPGPLGVMDNNTGGIGFFDSNENERVCMYLYKSMTREQSKKFSRSEYQNLWREELKDFTNIPGVIENLPSGEDMHMAQDRQFFLDKMYKGSIVLIGDSAHVRSIFGGAGSSIALEDAVVLGIYLNNEKSISSALEKYSESQNQRGRNIILPNLSGTKFGETVNDFLSTSPLFNESALS
ncbi:MAG: FAD-dependent monooxygenase [bacterium]